MVVIVGCHDRTGGGQSTSELRIPREDDGEWGSGRLCLVGARNFAWRAELELGCADDGSNRARAMENRSGTEKGTKRGEM